MTGYAKFKSVLIALVLANLCTPAHANPTNPTVINGTATFANPSPEILEITNSAGTIINWQEFSINLGEITRFLQPDSSSAILNRVIGTNPSQILGTLQSNGRVFLINPNGIVFGADAVVDVQGLIASTLDLSNQDFLDGNYRFGQIGAGTPITVENGAQITTATAGDGGQVWLMAKTIQQAGDITTPGGQTVLGAGTEVVIAESPLGNMIFTVTTDGTNDIQSLGIIAAQRGVAGLFADNITHSGTINAQSAVGTQGLVTINAENNLTIQDGGVINANSSDGSNASRINLNAGNQLEVQRLAEISADGHPSGGNGGEITLTAWDLRISPVANGYNNLHASDRDGNGSGVSGTVTLNQTGDSTLQPQGELTITDAVEVQEFASITALADGSFVVVWDSNQNSQSSNFDIYGRRYDASGNPVGAEFVISNAANQELFPSVTALVDGSFVVIWQDNENALQKDIHGRLFRVDGTDSELVVSNATGTQSNPTVTALADGGFVVAWDDPQTNSPNIYGRRYGADGIASPEFIISNTATRQEFPDVTALADGGFVVTWENRETGDLISVKARRYGADGTAGEAFVISEPMDSQRHPTITGLADGGFVVTWLRDQGGNRSLYGRRYQADGKSGSEFAIADTLIGDVINSTDVTALADGGFVAAWQSSGNDSDVFGRRYRAEGTAGEAFTITSATDFQFNPTITGRADGGFVGAWQNGSPETSNISGDVFAQVPAPLTPPDNRVTGEVGSVASFNTRPGLSNGVLNPPPDDGSMMPPPDDGGMMPPPDDGGMMPPADDDGFVFTPQEDSNSNATTTQMFFRQSSEIDQELTLASGVCQNLIQEPKRGPLPEDGVYERVLTTTATELDCRRQWDDQIHPEALGKGWNNLSQLPAEEQAYAQMVGEEEYTLTQRMSWRARQAYWSERAHKQASLNPKEFASYINQIRSLSETERVQYYEQLAR